MLKIFYLVALFVSLIEIIMFYEGNIDKTGKNKLLLLIVSFVANYGYAFESFAVQIGEAFCGIQIYYIGNTLTCLFLFFIIADICEVKLSRNLERFLFFIAFLIIVLVCVSNHTKVFFTNIELKEYLGAAYLSKDYGPLFNIYLLFLAGISFTSVTFMIYAILQRKKISRKTIGLLLVILGFTDLANIISFLFKFPLELYPFFNDIILAFLLYVFRHASLYDLTENLLNVSNQRQDFGYITFDKHKRFLGCNEFACKLIPGLVNSTIDSFLNMSEDEKFVTLYEWIDEWDKGNQKELKIANKGITAISTIRYIIYNNRMVGYFVEMHDVTKNQNQIDKLELSQHDLSLQVEEKTSKILHIQDSIITGMATMVESRDNSTGGHIKRTSEGVRIFVEQIKKHNEFKTLTKSFCKNMIKAAPMHDLGKIAIHDAVLQKPGKFTDEEYEEMKRHSTEGAQIVLEVLKEVDDMEFKIIAINVAHYHHEKWNGTGYPAGLKGEDIPIEARIMAFADVFDALVTTRCYKSAFSFDEAFKIMQDDFGTHFDPTLGPIFLECRSQLEAMYTLDALVNKGVE